MQAMDIGDGLRILGCGRKNFRLQRMRKFFPPLTSQRVKKLLWNILWCTYEYTFSDAFNIALE